MESRPFHYDLLQSLSPVGRALFSKFGRGPTVDPPFRCIHEAFEFHARNQPDAIAVEDGQVKITFAELDRQANCLGTHLRDMGIVPGCRVGLLVERSVYMVVGILGTLKAGGAYVPLDGNVISKGALAHAIRDSEAEVVLVQRKFADRVFMSPTLCIEDSICPRSSMAHCVKPEDVSAAGDSAYIIYTSGTTGDPHGVDVMHRNVINLVCIAPGNLAMSPGLRVAQLMNISFDMAAWEILGSLCNGSTLCLRGKTSKEWRAVMKTVDVVIATPSMLAPHDPTDYPNIKVVAVAGEHCPKGLADAWAQHVDFYNCCGPTEITIVNTMHLHFTSETLGIGSPTPNNTVYLLDDEMKPVKIGDVGVMWAGGAGVTRGYINLPDKTAERYKRDPFLNDGSVMFNTGDLARWHPDGDLEHLGRVDHQVKIKGFKVELDRVAAAMETTPGVKSATAILIDGELWGFFTPSKIEIETVKASTARSLPHYGVPTKYIRLNKFPETPNGKTDKRALEELAIKSPQYTPTSPAPIDLPPSNFPLPKTTPIYPLLIESEKRLPPGTEWTTSAGSTKQPVDDHSSVSSPIPPAPPPLIPSKSLKRLPSRKALNAVETRPIIEATEILQVPFPTIPSPSPFYQISTIHEPTDDSYDKEWNRHSTNSGMSWNNGSFTTIDTATYVGTAVSLPLKKEVDPSSLEDQTSIWAGYEQEILPEKIHSDRISRIRHRIASLYRRLFGLVFLINFCAFLAAASRHANASEINKAVIGNLFLANIMRQDYIVDAVFTVCTAIPTSWPLSVRRLAAQVHHIGGVHSGAGVSVVLWFIYFTGQATKEAAKGQKTSAPTVVITWFILLIFLAMLGFSIPRIRQKFYHSFETIHRFFGWGVMVLLWVQIPLIANDYRAVGQPLHVAIRQFSSFWLLLLMTISLALPWVRLRKVNVYSKPLSQQAVRMYFDYITPRSGSLIKISDDPLTEWHGFAAISEPGKPGFSVIISRAGDWTSNQVANPPTKMWVRGSPSSGVMRIAPIFRRIVLVATGSGIASCTPAVLEQKMPIRLLWVAPGARETFGDKLVDSIVEANPEAIIYNTNRHGQPDMVKLTYRLVKEFDAEAVIIISDKDTAERVVYGMVSRGIPAFGAICDSEET